MKQRIAIILTALLLAGCGGGGSQSTPSGTIVTNIGPVAQGKAGLSIVIRVPGGSAAATARRPQDVPSNAVSMQITALQGATTVATVTQNLNGASNGCTASSTGLVCTVTVALGAGSYTLNFATYNGTNATGQQLSIDSGVAATIASGQGNTVNVTLSGIPASMTIAPVTAFSIANGGNYDLAGSGNHAFTVQALDATGNVIVGPGSPTFTAAVTSGTLAATPTNPSAGTPNTFYIAPPAALGAGTATITVTANYATGLTNPCAAPTNAPCTKTVTVDMVAMLAIVNSTGGGGTGSVTFYKIGATTPFTTLTSGLNNPQSLAADGSGNVLVGNAAGGALLYAYGTGTSTALAGLGNVVSTFVDASGNFYAGDATNNKVVEYASGSTTASRTITTGISNPVFLTGDANGRLYVVNGTARTLTQYVTGGTTPAVSIAGFGGPTGAAVGTGATPEVYVADSGGGALWRFPYNTSVSDGDLGAGNGAPNPNRVVVDGSGNVYASNTGANLGQWAATVAWPVASTATYSTGISNPVNALLIDGSGNLYVANGGNSTVEFYPAGSTNPTLSIGAAGGISVPYTMAIVP